MFVIRHQAEGPTGGKVFPPEDWLRRPGFHPSLLERYQAAATDAEREAILSESLEIQLASLRRLPGFEEADSPRYEGDHLVYFAYTKGAPGTWRSCSLESDAEESLLSLQDDDLMPLPQRPRMAA